MIAALAVAERSTSAAMERSELYAKIRCELERIIACGYGQLHIEVIRGGEIIDITSSPRERYVSTPSGYYYESNTHSATN